MEEDSEEGHDSEAAELRRSSKKSRRSGGGGSHRRGVRSGNTLWFMTEAPVLHDQFGRLQLVVALLLM